MTDALGLIAAVLICSLAAAVGGAATAAAVRTWYPTLRKPTWNPPARLFGPIWSVLYLMMAVAVWLVWRTRDAADVRVALGLFTLQLALNVLWSVLFFGLRRPGGALLDIVVLWIAILSTAVVFWPLDPIGSVLLLPYLAWVTFAAALNGSIFRLNRAA
jgi:tryptophan-rich sensory protein